MAVKVGIIGKGFISASHRKAYSELTADGIEVEVVAVSDIRPEFTKDCVGKERVYGDYHELLEAEVGKLDFVDICLPTFLHMPAAVAALDLGYNVLCEKPMAIDTEAAQAMCDAAKRNNRKLMIAQSWRFHPYCAVMRDYVKQQKLGRVKCAHFNRNGGTPGWSWEGWHFDKNRSGGAFLDLHMHDVDAMNSIFGVPNAVTSAGQSNWPGSGYDIGATIYYYDNGLFVTSTVDWTTPHQKYSAASKVIVFENGYIYKGEFDGQSVFKAVDRDGNETDLLQPSKTSYYCEMKYYIDCVVNDKPITFCAPEESRDSVRIIMAECRSADLNGERVTL